MNSHLLPYPYNQPLARQVPGLRRLAQLLYDIPRRLYCPPSPLQSGVAPIRVVCISDTHNATPQVPDGDLLIHAGDLTQKGTFDELEAQLKWLASLPHPHKVVIAGNHDCLLDPAFVDRSRTRLSTNGRPVSDLQWKDIHYLQNTSVTLSFRSGRSLKVFGSPLTPEYGNWAFQYPAIRDAWTGKIPDDAEIVITHSPPALHCDAGKGGDGYLLRELRRCKPLLAVCGHAHDGYGEELLLHDRMQSVLDDLLLQAEGPAAIFRVLFWMGIAMVRRLLRLPTQATKLVNAALAPGSRRKEAKVPVVVDL